jgi:hypothetical protein
VSVSFAKLGGGRYRSTLVHIQRKVADLDPLAREHRKPIPVVAGHVNAIRIVVAEVQDDRGQAVGQVVLEALPGLVGDSINLDYCGNLHCGLPRKFPNRH